MARLLHHSEMMTPFGYSSQLDLSNSLDASFLVTPIEAKGACSARGHIRGGMRTSRLRALQFKSNWTVIRADKRPGSVCRPADFGQVYMSFRSLTAIPLAAA
jgi:hypothetical protein